MRFCLRGISHEMDRAMNRANEGMKTFVLELGKQGGMKGLVQESIKRRDVVSTRLTRTLNIPRRKVTHYNGNAEGAPNTIQKK